MPSSSLVSRSYAASLLPHGGSSKESSLFGIKLFTCTSSGRFPFFSVTNITKLERLHQAASRAISGCLSSSFIPPLLSEASLSILRVALTHFVLSSYEMTLCLPTSFPVLGFARLGVKPRLCRSSWRAFASTHPLMLPSTSLNEALLTFPLSSPWNLSSFTVESTFSSPCFRSDPLSLAKMRLSLTWTLSQLTIWYLKKRVFSFSFWQRRLWRTCQLFSLWH